MDCGYCIQILKQHKFIDEDVISFIFTNSQKNKMIKKFKNLSKNDPNYNDIKKCVRIIAKKNKCEDYIETYIEAPILPSDPVLNIINNLTTFTDIRSFCETNKLYVDLCKKLGKYYEDIDVVAPTVMDLKHKDVPTIINGIMWGVVFRLHCPETK